MTTQTTTTATLTKRAWGYLRVSSAGQVKTGYSEKGLSITGQQDAIDDKGHQLNAAVVRYWADPGKSAFVDLHKRTDFLEMLTELKRVNQSEATRVHYLIIYATDRWARNVQDHFHTHELVREAGSQLVSITEPLIGEDTPEAFYFEGMQAVHNEYESRRTARRVSGGLYLKAREGGSYGPAKLGYVNEPEELPSGKRVAGTNLDPKRHHFITTAFQLFASGEYSLSSLSDEMYALGLRSRKGNKVGTSSWQTMLRSRFYAGWVVFKQGTPDEEIFEGRHDPLIDEATFDKVQALLDEKRVSGERPQKHHHYLKGSVYCTCGHRLLFAFSRGRSGKLYPYFFCGSRRHHPCDFHRNFPGELVEEAVERYYAQRPVQLTAQDVKDRTAAIESMVAVSQEAATQVKTVKTALVKKLKDQQAKLLRLHLEEGDVISPDAFRDERQRLQNEIEAAERSLMATEEQLQLDATVLRMALELAGNVAEVYRKGPKALKRGYNQAFFESLVISPVEDDETGEEFIEVVDAELTKPYATVLAEDFASQALASAAEIQGSSGKKEDDPKGVAFFRSLFDLLQDGGAGWARTSDLRIMSPLL
jgi:site-specific DNA recombinase